MLLNILIYRWRLPPILVLHIVIVDFVSCPLIIIIEHYFENNNYQVFEWDIKQHNLFD
jgi:hypothetical protein